MPHHRIRRIAQEYIIIGNQRKRAFRMAVRNGQNLDMNSIVKRNRSGHGPFFAAVHFANDFRRMRANIKSVKIERYLAITMTHNIQQMVAVEMRNDDVLLERNRDRRCAFAIFESALRSVFTYGIARQGIDKIDRHIAGANVKNPPRAITTHSDNVRAQRLVRNLQILDSVGKLYDSWHDAKDRNFPLLVILINDGVNIVKIQVLDANILRWNFYPVIGKANAIMHGATIIIWIIFEKVLNK